MNLGRRGMRHIVHGGLIAACIAGAPISLSAQGDLCTTAQAHGPSPDLYCMYLTAVPQLPVGVAGHVQLDIAPGPFTVAVTRDGIHRYRPRITLSGLPAPTRIAPNMRGYVAWATTPRFAGWQRLGVVANGTTTLPEIALNQFIIVISAEANLETQSRIGPLVLRGGSPSTRLQPPDFQNFAAGVLGLTADELRTHSDPTMDHAAHAATGAARWTTVPMPPGFAMYPAEMALRPGVAAQLPSGDAETPLVRRTERVRLRSGDTLTLRAAVVRKRIHGREYVMYAFNGQIPGPLLQVERGTEVVVRFENRLEQPSSVHWHGLRQDWRMDGAPPLSQDPVPAGGDFTYTLRFPDAGLYWYHPHVREEMQQDLGLSGNIMVQGLAGLPRVTREEVLLLDDLLIGDDGIVPYGLEATTHALMGRFGNVLLVNGEPRWSDSLRTGETLRLWFTNAANTRTFNLSASNAHLRLVAADMGTFPMPLDVESVVLAPAERYAVDVTPTGIGDVVLTNRVQAIDHVYGQFVAQVDTLGTITVHGPVRRAVVPAPSRSAADVVVAEAPAFIFEFGLRTKNLPFTTERLMLLDSAYFHPVEWSGTMPMMNWATTAQQAEWFVRDAHTGQENEAASFTVKRGDVRTIRFVNTRNGLHAMQHPVHMHGQRFQVVAVNGVPTSPLHRAWKDTVLLPAGGTVDLVVEFSNPGHWMLHCHIAEHIESGMMTHFTVEE